MTSDSCSAMLRAGSEAFLTRHRDEGKGPLAPEVVEAASVARRIPPLHHFVSHRELEVDDAAVHPIELRHQRIEEAATFGHGDGAKILRGDVGEVELARRDRREPGGGVGLDGERQLPGPGDHFAQALEAGEADAPPAPAVHEAADHAPGIAGVGESFDATAVGRGGAGPGALAPDVGEVGPTALEGLAQLIEHQGGVRARRSA